jgi:hypothetical protein
MKDKKISQTEREEFFDFWSKQKEAVLGRVSEGTLEFMNLYTSPSGVGYEFGQLRPGKLGQWDLFYELTGPQSQNICDENEAMIACGLTATEVADEKRREHLRENCVDPDDRLAVVQFERLQRMSPTELDTEITRLESQLGLEPLST